MSLSIFALMPFAGAQDGVGGGSGSGESSLGQQASSSYVIRPLDYLTFRIIGEPETEVRVRLSAEGVVALPFVGEVKLQGLTVFEAKNRVTQLYDGDYYINPQIDLSILAYSDRSVEVIGYVLKQGPVGFPSEQSLYLLEAISKAGGFDRLAGKNKVTIRRQHENGEFEEFTVDTEKISAREVPLEDGDVITVPRRVW